MLAIVTLIAVLATGLMAVANLRLAMRTSDTSARDRSRSEALVMLRWAAELAVDGHDTARSSMGIEILNNLQDADFVQRRAPNFVQQAQGI